MVEAAQGRRPGRPGRWPGSANAPRHGPCQILRAAPRRATLTRQWELFFAEYPVLLLPVSAELPFPDQLDLAGDDLCARLARADAADRRAVHGLPALSVAMGSVPGAKGTIPVGVQLDGGPLPRGPAGRGRGDRAAGQPIDIAEPGLGRRRSRTRMPQPASGFDPAGFCVGYQTAGGRARRPPTAIRMTRHAGGAGLPLVTQQPHDAGGPIAARRPASTRGARLRDPSASLAQGRWLNMQTFSSPAARCPC